MALTNATSSTSCYALPQGLLTRDVCAYFVQIRMQKDQTEIADRKGRKEQIPGSYGI